jgi:type IV pilus assembly protein PilM
MFGGSKSIVGLDIGSHSIKAVEVSRSGGGLALTGVAQVRVNSPDRMVEAIRETFAAGGFKTKKVISAVSGRAVIVRYVPMANMPDEELRRSVAYEAEKYLPFDVDEVILDCQRMEDTTVPEGPGGQIKVLLVAVKRSVVDEHLSLVQQAGLTPVVIDCDYFALGNAWEARSQRMGDQDEVVRALIDIGAAKTSINIVKGQASHFTRDFYVAGNDLTEMLAKRFGESPEDVERMKEDPGDAQESMQEAFAGVLEDIASEIRLSFDYYENQFDQQVEEVLLSGGTVIFPNCDSMLGEILGMETRLWDPMEALDTGALGAQLSQLGNTTAGLAVAVGLGSRLNGM